MGAASHIQSASRVAQLRLLTAEQSTDQWLQKFSQACAMRAASSLGWNGREGCGWLTDNDQHEAVRHWNHHSPRHTLELCSLACHAQRDALLRLYYTMLRLVDVAASVANGYCGFDPRTVRVCKRFQSSGPRIIRVRRKICGSRSVPQSAHNCTRRGDWLDWRT